MTRTFAIAAGMAASLVAGAASAGADHSIRVGKLKIASGIAGVTIAFENRSSADIAQATVSCGFLNDGDMPVGQGYAIFENVAAGDSAYQDAAAFNAGDATKADCRIESIR